MLSDSNDLDESYSNEMKTYNSKEQNQNILNISEKNELSTKVYNCYTCNIQIYNFSFFRYHFKSEWHKYNLKRKLLNLSCIDELTFNQKIHQLNKLQDEKEEKEKDKKQKKKKKMNKNFEINKNLNNTKNKADLKYASNGQDLLKNNVNYENVNVCFFDNRLFDTMEENIKYMKDEYNFYIPDEEYAINLKKILLVIGNTIYKDNMCIYCFKYFNSIKAIQLHMNTNGHTQLHEKFFVFIEKYYDFSETYVNLINEYIQNKEDKKEFLQLLNGKLSIQDENKNINYIKNENENVDNDNDIYTETDDYKITHKDLNKNLKADDIYELLENFGYTKPGINEYNNLILPNGSEAINRNLAYLFKQKLTLSNNVKNKKLVLVKTKENDYKIKHFKNYLYYINKYNLNLNLKNNKINKFIKSDTINFI